MAGFPTLRDAVGTPASDPSAHGSAFDRVGAFQDGFLNGAARCVEYEEIFQGGGATVVDVPAFDEAGDLVQLDAPFDPNTDGNIFELTFGSLEQFWLSLMPDFGGVEWDPLFADDQIVAFDPGDPETLPRPECPGLDITAEDVAGRAFTCFGDPTDQTDDYIAFDIDLAVQLYEGIGDFAVAGIVPKQYAFIAQVLAGNLDDDLPSNLQADCLSGVYTGAVTAATFEGTGFPIDREGNTVTLSPGDLDEVVASFLVLGQNDDPTITGTPFLLVAAYPGRLLQRFGVVPRLRRGRCARRGRTHPGGHGRLRRRRGERGGAGVGASVA